MFTKCYCLIGNKRVLILKNYQHKNIIEVGLIIIDGLFKIELIIDFKNNYIEEEKKLLEMDLNIIIKHIR